MITLTADENAVLKPFKSDLVSARAEMMAAAAAHAAVSEEERKIDGELAALGAEPRPADFSDANAWHAAVAERAAKAQWLARSKAENEALQPAATDRDRAAADRVAAAKEAFNRAAVELIARRVDARREGMAEEAAFIERNRIEALPIGKFVDRPKGLTTENVLGILHATIVDRAEVSGPFAAFRPTTLADIEAAVAA